MKIIFLNASSQLGGAERCLIDNIFGIRQELPTAEIFVIITAASGAIVNELQPLDVQVILLPLPDRIARLGDSSFDPQKIFVNLFRLFTPINELLNYWHQLRNTVADINPDLIHSNSFKTHLLGSSLRLPQPIIWHLHDFISDRLLMKRLLHFVKHENIWAIANSKSTKDDWHNIFPRLPIKVIYNVVDIDRFAPDSGLRATIPSDNPDLIKVGLVATYARWKGHDIFLQSIAHLVQHHPQSSAKVRFYIVGGAIYETARSQYSRSELVQLTRDLNIEDWVEFIDFRSDIESIYNSLDIVVHASTKPEPFGRTIVEAMACEKAVIVANAGGAAELFTHERDALGVTPGNPHDLADAIWDLIESPTKRSAIGTAARQTVVERFNRDRLGAELVDIYTQML
ncbi:glycosyltransferase family 4 protein [Chamaesiphon sp. VAR_48_metabat_135_sub]|uniref:glycosyltransferase family 4 protein n=1 Tax=Chamaesiphon sp. VAR_48_metabat_135_sub TaxID=2964699 RepID=UPI00286D6737|nr:glycosyltransferase family 4 protein [Chamaesiphon sp. VAR_48_metabat_135_sub]